MKKKIIQRQGFKIKDGDYFEGIIGYTLCMGRFTIENDKLYLCQNEKSGAQCDDKKGYALSWAYDEAVILQKVYSYKSYDKAKFIMSRKLYEIITSEYCVKVNGDLVCIKMRPKSWITDGDNFVLNIPSELNCFTIRAGQISYSRGKQSLNSNAKWDRDGRNIMKPSTFLQSLDKYLPKDPKVKNRLIELISASVKSNDIVVQVSDDVGDIYEMPTSSEGTGTLGSSCMRPEASYEGNQYVRQYNNVRELKIAYSQKNGYLLARALLWHDIDSERGKIKFMDRIYGTEQSIAAFQEWAHENGYYHKVEQSSGNSELLGSNGERVRQMTLSNAIKNFGGFPYTDTMNYLTNTNALSTYLSGRSLQNTDGNTDEQCEECGSTNELHYTMDTERYLCSGCCTYIDEFGYDGWYEHTNRFRINNYWERLPEDWEDDDYVWVEGRNSYYHRDNVIMCEKCEEYLHENDVIFDEETDKYYCGVCYNNLIKEREQNELCESENQR